MIRVCRIKVSDIFMIALITEIHSLFLFHLTNQSIANFEEYSRMKATDSNIYR